MHRKMLCHFHLSTFYLMKQSRHMWLYSHHHKRWPESEQRESILLCSNITAVTYIRCTFAAFLDSWPPRSHKYRSLSQRTLPSNNSSKSSTKNSFRGGRFGLFRVFKSCWILEDTLLLTGTPVTGETERIKVKTNHTQEKCARHHSIHWHRSS